MKVPSTLYMVPGRELDEEAPYDFVKVSGIKPPRGSLCLVVPSQQDQLLRLIEGVHRVIYNVPADHPARSWCAFDHVLAPNPRPFRDISERLRLAGIVSAADSDQGGSCVVHQPTIDAVFELLGLSGEEGPATATSGNRTDAAEAGQDSTNRTPQEWADLFCKEISGGYYDKQIRMIATTLAHRWSRLKTLGRLKSDVGLGSDKRRQAHEVVANSDSGCLPMTRRNVKRPLVTLTYGLPGSGKSYARAGADRGSCEARVHG